MGGYIGYGGANYMKDRYSANQINKTIEIEAKVPNGEEPVRYIYDNYIQKIGYDYPGVETPTFADFFETFYEMTNYSNAINLAKDGSWQAYIISLDINCGEVVTGSLCYNVGPPPRDVVVSRHPANIFDPNTGTRCMTFPIKGHLLCPESRPGGYHAN